MRIQYLIYRWILACVFCCILIASILDLGRPPHPYIHYAKWPIYLTHWGFLVCTIQAVLAAVIVTQTHWYTSEKPGKLIIREHIHIYIFVYILIGDMIFEYLGIFLCAALVVLVLKECVVTFLQHVLFKLCRFSSSSETVVFGFPAIKYRLQAGKNDPIS